MKRILIALLLFAFTGYVQAQKLPSMGYKVHITQADKTIVAEISPLDADVVPKKVLTYYWYTASTIQTTQGGFSGKLLNGIYNEYYLNKNLKEQGNFSKGLKDGTWKSWNEDGTLNQAIEWRNGLVYVKKPSKFWKKINIFKKKPKNALADSAAKP